MQPKIRFLDLPGIRLLESEAMIAEKFHQRLPQNRVDEISRAIFGTTEDEIFYDPPHWFVDGFESLEDWQRAPSLGDFKIGPYHGTDYYGEFEEGSPRAAIYQEMEDFDWKLCGGREIRDDFDRVKYASKAGIDFSDETGNYPLRVTGYFFRQAIAAAFGMNGHLPDLAELGVEEWGAKLAEDRRRFEKAKRKAG